MPKRPIPPTRPRPIPIPVRILPLPSPRPILLVLPKPTETDGHESPNCRRKVRLKQYLQEKIWFATQFVEPKGVPTPCELSEINSFQRLIWENPPDIFIEKYGSTPEKMSVLCGQGRDGRLMSSHIKWILEKVNKKSQDSLCVCMPSMSLDYVKEIHKSKSSSLSRLIFVVNVGKETDDSVYIASAKKPGSHWVLVVVELVSGTVYYCDSLGWSVPSILILETLSAFTQNLDIPSIKHAKIISLHVPSTGGRGHSCSKMCANYPLQLCDNVSGIVAVIFAAVAALDFNYFGIFLKECSFDKKSFLHDPSKYERYLRRILISWFMKEDITVLVLKDKNFHSLTQSSTDHSYSDQSPTLKRKADDVISNETTKSSKCSLDDDSKPSTTISSVDKLQSCSVVLKGNDPRLLKYVSSASKTAQPSVAESSQLSDDSSVAAPSQFSNVVLDGESYEMSNVVAIVESSLESPVSTCPVSSSEKILSAPAKAKHQCPFCNALVSSRQSLCRHKLRKHKALIVKNPNLKFTYCQLCKNFKTLKIQDLIKHYSQCHNQKIDICKKSFRNENEFNEWKKKVETESCTQFIQISGVKKVGRGCFQVKYLYCNRSGFQKFLPVRKRAQRSQGSLKIDNKCTAYMIARIDTKDGSVYVEYCLHHIGHSFEIGGHKSTNVTKHVEDTPQSQEAVDDLGFVETVVCHGGKPEDSRPITTIEKLHDGFSNEISKLLEFGLNCTNVDCLQMMCSRVREIVTSASVMQGDYKVVEVVKPDVLMPSSQKIDPPKCVFTVKKKMTKTVLMPRTPSI